MQKISRIYIGNAGYSAAWYDGITFSLLDRFTNEPTDVIINLENGGGKSTLLSLVFSCFETSQDRFLKHIHDKVNHFSQYFSNDGLPGFIVVEWLMPPRAKGSAPYRLVTGQAVSVKPGADGPDIDRVFFSFEEKSDLSMDLLPAPKLAAAPAGNLAEFSRWIHEQQARHPGDVYITRKQGDWQKHLRDERLIDLEMLQMQVNFSAQEGGIGKSFLDFRTEPEFLRKFFQLTMDAQHSESVRHGVVVVCDKLRRKPEYKLRLQELNKFRGILLAFNEDAMRLRQVQAQQAMVKLTGARLAVALQARSEEQVAQQEQAEACEAVQRELSAGAAADNVANVRRSLTFMSLWHQKNLAAASELTATAKAARQAALDAVEHVKAARLASEIASFDYQIGDLETQRELASEGLKEFQDYAEVQGALLRTTLFEEQRRLQGQASCLEQENAGRHTRIKELKAGHRQDSAQHQLLVREQSTLDAEEKSYGDELRHLVADGLLLGASEPAGEAAARWLQLHEQYLGEKASHEAQAAVHDAEARKYADTEQAEGQKAATLAADIRNENAFIAEGSAERERLSQLHALLDTVQADQVDPESAALPRMLQERVAAYGREIAMSAVRLAELEATKQAIDDTGVAGNNPDVATVLAVLASKGIASARPFNEYLAKALPDASRARAVVLSNPARFAGISVAQAEFEAVRAMQWEGALPSKPVVISPSALDPEPSSGHVVVPASTDAAYNREAAAVLARSLSERISSEQRRRASYEERQSQAQAALEQLRLFAKRFGDGKLRAAQNRVDQMTLDQRAAEMRAEQAKGRRVEEQQKARESAEAVNTKANLAAEAARHGRTLQRFAKEREEPRQARLERLEVIAGQVEELEARKLQAEEEWSLLEEAVRLAFEQKVQLTSHADGMARELSGVDVYSKSVDAKSMLAANPVDLITLRRTYADARATLRTEEDKRLGLLGQQLEAARKQKKAKQDDYARDFPRVTKVHIKPYEGADHDALLPGLTRDVATAEAGFQKTSNDEAVAKSDSTEWHRKNKDVPTATPQDESLALGALLQGYQDAARDAAQALERKQKADGEADSAKQRAAALKQQAKADADQARLLRASLELGAVPAVDLLELEVQQLAGEPAPSSSVLPHVNASEQVAQLMADFTAKGRAVSAAEKKAKTQFDALKDAVNEKSFQDVEPHLAAVMRANDFEATCLDSRRLLEGLEDRIGVTESTLRDMQADFDHCAGELLNFSREAITLLTQACNKKVPQGAMYVGGKAILKMRANFQSIALDTRKQVIQAYLDHLIDTNVLPQKGSELVAEAVVRIYGKDLGIQVLKMVPEEARQYTPLHQISNSGGEGVVMAMFLYGVMSQLRAETQASPTKGGGPLILDNPFANVTLNAMWRAQRLLAQAMGIQLVFTTAIQDYNALGEFPYVIRVAKAGVNSKTSRTHLQTASYSFNEGLARAA